MPMVCHWFATGLPLVRHCLPTGPRPRPTASRPTMSCPCHLCASAACAPVWALPLASEQDPPSRSPSTARPEHFASSTPLPGRPPSELRPRPQIGQVALLAARAQKLAHLRIKTCLKDALPILAPDLRRDIHRCGSRFQFQLSGDRYSGSRVLMKIERYSL